VSAERLCFSAACEWCGRSRGFFGDRPDRVFCRVTPCAFAQQLLDLVLEEERALVPRPEFSALVWGELEVLTLRIPSGPQVVAGDDQLSMGLLS
jgi:hypothetical protein